MRKKCMFAGFVIAVKTENKDLESRQKQYFYFKPRFCEPQHQKYKAPQELCEQSSFIFARENTATCVRIFFKQRIK